MSNERSLLSPSSAHRWLDCTAYLQLLKKEHSNLIEKNDYPAAKGTVLHKILEECLIDNLNANEFLNDVFTEKNFSIKINEDDCFLVQYALDHVRNLKNKLQKKYEKVELICECFLKLDFLGLVDLKGGTADIIILCKNKNGIIHKLYMIDFKSGFLKIEAKNNSQLLLYMLGAFYKYKKVINISSCDFINVIVQPAQTVKSSYHKFKYKELLAFQNKVISTGDIIYGNDPEFKPSYANCVYCPVKNLCEARVKSIIGSAKDDFLDLIETERELLSDKQKIRILKSKKLFLDLIKELEIEVETELFLENKTYTDNFSLVERFNKTYITPEGEKKLNKLLGGDIYRKKLLNLSEIKKLLTDKLGSNKAIEAYEEVTERTSKGEFLDI